MEKIRIEGVDYSIFLNEELSDYTIVLAGGLVFDCHDNKNFRNLSKLFGAEMHPGIPYAQLGRIIHLDDIKDNFLKEKIKTLIDFECKPSHPEILDAYTRKDALSDGEQIRVSDFTRAEAGFLIPVFITKAVNEKYIKPPVEMPHQDYEGRLWDTLIMLNHYIKRNQNKSFFLFSVLYQMPDKGDWEPKFEEMEDAKRTMRKVTLKAVVSSIDIDNSDPAITIMKPNED